VPAVLRDPEGDPCDVVRAVVAGTTVAASGHALNRSRTREASQVSASRDVCLLGTALICGSSLSPRAPATAFGWNRSAPGADAAHAAGFEVSTDLPATLRRAADRDALVVVGVPLPALGPVLDAVAEHAPSVALTDVVSVKSPVLEAVRERDLAARFVGGHPMAGTARSGWEATDPDLFRDATWFVAADD